jgi:hypothetical protein
MAWSVPVVAVATSAPAFGAASPGPVRVVPCGVACKHPGSGQNDKTYHFTFCFTTNQPIDGNTVHLDAMQIEEVTKPNVSPTTVNVVPGQTTCIYVDAPAFPDSRNGQATLFFHYFLNGQRIDGTVQTDFNDIPRCGTADGGVNPKDWPHDPFGPPPPQVCVVP